MEYYLAIDIGASSGRHIAGWLAEGKLHTKELYRFENRLVQKSGRLFWDIEALYAEVLKGLERCNTLNMIPVSVGIDTWAVDFILLDSAGARLGEAISYRDARTEGMDAAVERALPFPELYRRTGIQKQPFNTIYQLMALKKQEPALLERAAAFLMIPDYLHYRLTGIISQEYTNASTTALLNVQTRDWDTDIIETLGFPAHLFQPLKRAGQKLGVFSAAVRAQLGFSATVILPATHDTGSAFVAVPAVNAAESVYLSSGTWSLLGIESASPLLTDAARDGNFTNEGAYQSKYRFLKNIMGLWMIQAVRHELESPYSFSALAEMAQEATSSALFAVNDPRFLAPQSMRAAIQDICRETGQQVPKSIGEIMLSIYRSLAACYQQGLAALENITGKTFRALHIVGGGSKDAYLNELTAHATGLPVHAGPVEATVIGNLCVQMISSGVLPDLETARKIIAQSFDLWRFPSDGSLRKDCF
ncbi:MAG: rhamnulokinase [Spirochaetaceae bacterium]|jgi:rhamnulokinase|nr:rhamnulokinase [Spirochaetaceae bacterium]